MKSASRAASILPEQGRSCLKEETNRTQSLLIPEHCAGKREHAAAGNMNWYQDSDINNAHLLTRQF